MGLKIKRAYSPAADSDGERVLVDRIWPRGVSKEDAAIDWWAKELAPSTDLRKWFDHDPAKFSEFVERYRKEVEGKAQLDLIRKAATRGTVTLVFAARDEEHNNARALQLMLEG